MAMIEPPPSVLGIPYAKPLGTDPDTFKYGIKSVEADRVLPTQKLIEVTVDPVTSSVFLDSFFYQTSKEVTSHARRVALDSRRTLVGLGMEWVKAVADAYGCTKIHLQDSFRGTDGLTSRHLSSGAETALLLDIVNRRARRAAGELGDDPAFRTDYLERVMRGGYYGQWGFKRDPVSGGVDQYNRPIHYRTHTVDVNDMVELSTGFVDLEAR